MKSMIISDVHIGSPYLQPDWLVRFLERVPDGTQLILNGDTIDDPTRELDAAHQHALDALLAAAKRLQIVWILGNHDETLKLPADGNIKVVNEYHIGDRILITHGHTLDTVMPAHQVFIKCFRWFHNMCMNMGAPRIHVAQFAKNFPILYNHLNRRVRQMALDAARARGFAAVTCGHVHYAEDYTEEDVRYINTGSWTESPNYCILVGEEKITVCPSPQDIDTTDLFTEL